jgi:hypothetical protein
MASGNEWEHGLSKSVAEMRKTSTDWITVKRKEGEKE